MPNPFDPFDVPPEPAPTLPVANFNTFMAEDNANNVPFPRVYVRVFDGRFDEVGVMVTRHFCVPVGHVYHQSGSSPELKPDNAYFIGRVRRTDDTGWGRTDDTGWRRTDADVARVRVPREVVVLLRRELLRGIRGHLGLSRDDDRRRRYDGIDALRRDRNLGAVVRASLVRLRKGDSIDDIMPEDDDSCDVSTLAGALWSASNNCPLGLRSLDAIGEALSNAGAARRIRLLECGHYGVRVRSTRALDGVACSRCFDENYVMLRNGGWSHRDNAYYWESDDEYHDEPEPDEDEDEDEDEESSDNDPNCVMEYSVNVLEILSIDHSFETTATGDFHMGVELETIYTGAAHSRNKVQAVRRELGDDYVVAKFDGSLSNSRISGHGIEWVTRPTSLKTHLAKFGTWAESAQNLVAWDARCCGMHVHIDSKAFTPLSLGKMLQFFNKTENVDFIRHIAGRHPDKDEQAQCFAARDIAAESAANPVKALKGKGTDRYTMVNLTNLGTRESRRLRLDNVSYGSSNTVEVRIFRASMRKERLLAQLEFTHALVVFCRIAGFRSVDAKDFIKWLSGRTQEYGHLARFLEVRPNRHGTPRVPATTHPVPAPVDETEAVEAVEAVEG